MRSLQSGTLEVDIEKMRWELKKLRGLGLSKKKTYAKWEILGILE